ncbi:IPTL-CTERM sorting domain-containing protein [Comamonas koreensis]|jgi:hypothetical protein|uniref:IPTL-CTERM sorting domain-containing protein n=1 Tax=Comamonas koreensis TaxID=160825 RepID=UPI0015F827E2|nr:IPTL-CTERM sorting domain-containing protein [Comamonas koreensis]
MYIKRLLFPLVIAAVAATSSFAQTGIFTNGTLSSDLSFKDELASTSMTLAYDGSHYWSSSGGSASGERLAQYSSAGALVAKFASGLDFRSVFTQGANLYARQFNDATIYQQAAAGTFAPLVTLTDLTEQQVGVVLNGAGNEYIALVEGNVYRWSLAGSPLGSVALVGFGTQPGENEYPQNRGISASGSYWFTYSQGVVSAWDAAGQRVGQTSLAGAGTSFDSHFSFSFANGRFWVVDQAGAAWRGYPLVVLAISPASLPAGKIGVAYSSTMTAGGGTAPYTWSASGLPAGLSIGAETGVISGVPSEATTAEVTISVVDSENRDKSTNITLVIDPLDLTVNPSLPNGQVGKTYTASIGVSGGVAPYHLVLDGELPEGLSLDLTTGAITGTPTKTQISTFSVTVSDSTAISLASATKAAVNSVTQSYTITISAQAAPAPVPTLGAWGLVCLSLLLGVVGRGRSSKRTA